jgi:hypothetical protein
VLGILPLFLFTNLHIVHDYYQTANLVFFILALSIAIGSVLLPRLGTQKALYSLFFIMAINYFYLSQTYFPWTQFSFNKFNSRDYGVGRILNRELSEDKQFVAFGNLWSSTFAYMSERKACTIEPAWYERYPEFISHPENCVEPGRLGAVLSCATNPSLFDLLSLEVARKWKMGEAFGCFFVLPENNFEHLLKTTTSKAQKCIGAIDNASYIKKDGKWVLLIKGWSVLKEASTERKIEPEQVVIKLSKKGMAPIYLDTLKTPHHPALNTKLGLKEDFDLGFSRAAIVDLPPGDYEMGLYHSKGDLREFCKLPNWKIG